jgi:hypothetical protein
MIHRRLFTSGILATTLCACVTVPVRPLPLTEVQGWRVRAVTVQYAPDASVLLAHRLNAYVQRELPKVAPGLEGLPLDPANPGRNVYAEKAIEISSTPQAQAYVRTEGAEVVRSRFQQVFAQFPSGQRPVDLHLIIKQLAEQADSATIIAEAHFIDPQTNRILLVHPRIAATRASRQSAMAGAAIGGGIIALVAVAAVSAALDSGRPPPFIDVIDQSAVGLRSWLLKREGE